MRSHRNVPAILVTVLLSHLAGVWSPHGEAAEPVNFVRDVGPIFERRCLRCHSTEKAEGELSFSSRADFLRGGETGAVVVAGKPDESLLIEVVSGNPPKMPAKGSPLTKVEVERLRAWIAAGAEWPENAILKESIAGGHDWWSFQPVQRPTLPQVKQERWARNDLDLFVLASLDERGLAPSNEADRRTLIRRLSFDLLGLPPSFEDVEAFLADADPRAYEKLVDHLLKSPHYGERWARHWLDIAHYADTHGFERDQRRDNAWPYRDYVIRSLNADKPYNDFLREQIAGDVLRSDDPEAVIATGFLAAGPWDFVGQVETKSDVLKRAARADDLDDMVTQVMTAACGVTVNCARCHDHKLDPISQREYYQLWSVFAGVRRGDRDSAPAEVRRVDGLRQKLIAERETVRAGVSRLRGVHLNLADIVGGGNGRGTGKVGSGIDPLTGKTQVEKRGFLDGAKPNTFAKSAVTFVDGVVVPDATDDGTQISSTGLRVKGVPKTSGQVWDAIRFGPANSQFSTILSETDFAADDHSLLSLHANAAITFDLVELRKAGAPIEMKFIAAAGYFGQTPKAGASFFVYVDGELKTQRTALGRDDGPIPVAVSLPAEARFLTLMATDNGNGIGHDQICFGDPWLVAAKPAELTESQRTELAGLEQRLVQLERELPSLPSATKVYAVVGEPSPVVHVLHRGDPERPREAVTPGALNCLSGLSGELHVEGGEGERRRALAEWIVSPANPLTRRVLVNRLWHHHFGVGLVETPSDFGFGGGRPTHPELLDWLAEEFAKNGWSLKQMHRLICTSATYRQQSSARRSPEQDVDNANRLLWHMNPRRLDAESLRDAVLTVSGKLNPEMFGPGYRDFEYMEAYAPIYIYLTPDKPELWRRSVYRFVVRTTPQQFLTTLDCPNPANLTPTRNATTTALQSLALWNNDFMLRQADFFAERVQRDAGMAPEAQVGRAFALAFGRQPAAAESTAAAELLKSNGLPQLCRMLLNANEFVYVD